MYEETELISKIAHRYAARCWWVDLNDLIQEGWIALLRAKRTWDPDRGIAFKWYAGRAVALTMRDYLWRMSAPVTGPKGHGEKLEGLYRAPMENLASHMEEEAPDIDKERWWAELTGRMEEVLRDSDSSGVAVRVVLLNENAATVAAELGIALKEVRSKARAARKRLRSDTLLREMVMAT